ncbi:hypothetical protein ACHAXR_006893, partial [Thalassiosira sp. AJA248-18]
SNPSPTSIHQAVAGSSPSHRLGWTDTRIGLTLSKFTMNRPGTTSRSLQQIIESDYLSNISFHLNEAYSNRSDQLEPPCSTGHGSSDQPTKNKLHSLNATKLALLLSKSFAELEGKFNNNEEGGENDLSLLQISDFILNFQPGKPNEGGEMVQPSPVNIDILGSKVNGSLDDDDDIIDMNLLSDVFDSPNQQPNGEVPRKKLLDNIFDKLDINDEKIVDTAKTPSLHLQSKTWTLLSIDIIPIFKIDSNQKAPHHKKMSPMQILGNHIHAIYSRGNQQSFSLPSDTTISPDLEENSSKQRSSKQRATNGRSLFSSLLETGEYPVSVCRLLSDMIESGDGESAENPFTSFDDVIQDLEQMSNHPETFLYDQGNDFYSSNVLFGQGCYGRVNELTKLLEISTRLEGSDDLSSPPLDGSEAVFVSGAAGSGKSHFVQNVGSFLENLGWMVLKVKFERVMEHGSREIVSSLFEKLVSNLVAMKSSSNKEDADYGRQAANAISDALDKASMSSLAEFIPSMQQLIPEIDRNSSIITEADMSHWQLVFLLTQLLGAILSLPRRIMMCLDDLQWCDSTMLMVIREIILYTGQNPNLMGRFLFVGIYRDEEVTETHPFAKELATLRTLRTIVVTELKLSSLSTKCIADMIMSETRLPMRLVRGLAAVAHKKTSGHALFVVHLLNSLVHDSTIAYSPRKQRFDWNERKIASLRALDSVATLFISNLSSLQTEALQSLRTLSCFGVQIPLSLVKLLDGSPCAPEQGIESFLPGLADRGVVEVTGPSAFFSHDLVQQHVYHNIPVEERRQLHLDIGTYIACKIGLGLSLLTKSFEDCVEDLKFVEPDADQESSSPPYALVAVATNQINFAGPEAVSDRSQQMRFAQWNLQAGRGAAKRSNFQTALYYYKSGIAFLIDQLWLEDTHQLCHDLYEGVALASFGIGDYSLTVEKATTVIDHVPFEESLVTQYILIRSLDSLGRYEEGASTGLELLRKLKFDIATDPSPSSVMAAMAETRKAASAYSFNQITSRRQIVDSKNRNVYKIVEALVISFFRSTSPYFPLVACAAVNYTLHNGICEDSAIAFVLFGGEKLSLLLNSVDELLKSMMKHSKEGAKMALLNKMLVSELAGKPCGPFPDFGVAIHDERALLADAVIKKNLVLIEGIHFVRFNSAFWRGGKSML